MAKPKSKSKSASKSKKPSAKKPVGKAASKKAAPKKAAPKKAAPKKAAPKKAAPKKAAPKKAAPKKAAPKKAAPKKAAPKKRAATAKPAPPMPVVADDASPDHLGETAMDDATENETTSTDAEPTEAAAPSTINVHESKGLIAKLVDKVKAVVSKPAQPEKRPPPPASQTPVGLSPELKARIQAALPEGSFAEEMRNLSVHSLDAWTHADMPELMGLERWGRELATNDLQAGIAALVEAARFGFPRAAEAGREELVDVGFFADHPSVDGAPVETQIEVAAAWLDNPDHLDAVKNAFDQTRQLHVWDDDLRPEDGRAYWWYTEVGQCCCAAIIRDSSKADGSSYYEWDPATIVGRGLVMAVRGVRQEETNVDEILDEMRDAMLA